MIKTAKDFMFIMLVYKPVRSFFLFFFLLSPFCSVLGNMVLDTILLQQDEVLVTKDSIYEGKHSPQVVLSEQVSYWIRKDHGVKTKALYDSISSITKKVPVVHSLFNGLRIRENIKIVNDSASVFSESELYFMPYTGKIIRKIHYKGVDIFEGSVKDITKKANTWGGRVLNKSHYDTRVWVLRNYIRFSKGDAINPLLMSENERILRGLGFIEDSKIYVTELPNTKDTVDILVVTKDNFPIGANVEVLNYNHILLDPYTTNFIGLGHKISGRMIYNEEVDQKFGYGAEYKVENLLGDFVSSTFGFSKTNEHDVYNVEIKKPFVSTEIKFGGELKAYQIAETKQIERQEDDTLISGEFYYKVNIYDAWSGYSFYYLNKSKNQFFNISARYSASMYLDRPFVDAETNFAFHDVYSNLVKLSFRNIDYLKTSKLFGFGRTEDVPYGDIIDFTGGYQWNGYYQRPYMGAFYSRARNYRDKGYFSLNMALGGFYRQNKIEDFVVGGRFSFYSPLLKLWGYEFRNTINATFNSVDNKLYYSKINFGNDLWLLRQDRLYGDSKFSFRTQTIFYSNLNLWGFRFAFYPFVDMGWLASDAYFIGNKQFFAVYGIGTQIKNESLTLPGLHVRAGFMPHTVNAYPNFGISFLFTDLSVLTKLRDLKPIIIDPFFYR